MYKVKDVMRSNLITVSETTEILDVITILAENKITGVPVVDEKSNLLGLVTEKDILSIAYRIITDVPGALSSHENAGDIMTKDVVSFRPDDNLADVYQCFIDNSFRRIMVTENGKLVGLISRKEIISYSFIKLSMGTTRA